MIQLLTSDKKIWNWTELVSYVTEAMCCNKKIIIDFTPEGPCIHATGLEDFLLSQCNQHNYDPNNITVITYNMIEPCAKFNIKKQNPDHLIGKTLEQYQFDINKKINKHFGMFVGRSSAPRLDIATYLYNDFNSEQTYHYDVTQDIHNSNIGLEQLVQDFNITDVSRYAEFLTHCPLQHTVNYKNDSLSDQLIEQDSQSFLPKYNNFFVEIVCETFYSGATFFPTEKTWRPMQLLTPFIVHGPKNYLQHIREMGFKTFDGWWNEGYSECDPVWQLKLIKEIVDDIATWSMDKCQQVYEEMQPVLHHNKKRLGQLWKL